jgi:hypothetical protein
MNISQKISINPIPGLSSSSGDPLDTLKSVFSTGVALLLGQELRWDIGPTLPMVSQPSMISTPCVLQDESPLDFEFLDFLSGLNDEPISSLAQPGMVEQIISDPIADCEVPKQEPQAESGIDFEFLDFLSGLDDTPVSSITQPEMAEREIGKIAEIRIPEPPEPTTPQKNEGPGAVGLLLLVGKPTFNSAPRGTRDRPAKVGTINKDTVLVTREGYRALLKAAARAVEAHLKMGCKSDRDNPVKTFAQIVRSKRKDLGLPPIQPPIGGGELLGYTPGRLGPEPWPDIGEISPMPLHQ